MNEIELVRRCKQKEPSAQAELYRRYAGELFALCIRYSGNRETARDLPNVRAVSFNFHTPYPDTRQLALTREDKVRCCHAIARMKRQGAPVFNLTSAFPFIIRGDFPTPCYQCVVMENGKLSTCGRCISVPGLCSECGYFFVAEYTLLFGGRPEILLEMLATYLKYI